MKKILLAVVTGLVFSACAPSSPQARIAKNPEKFAALGKRDQELVQQGQLGSGMSPDAVMLAWGVPDQIYEGSKDSKPAGRWDYLGSRPIYPSTYFGGFGYGLGGYGPYGRGGYYGAGFAVGPDLAYVPYRVASVWFVNHRVESWERIR
ncbi:MAG: hypothetical protein V4819_13830 [Verrucomicrobiota bacterium]